MVPRQPVVPAILPLFALQDQVVFPHTVFPLYIPANQMALLDEALRCESMVGLFAEVREGSRDNGPKLAAVGTACRINQVFRFPEGGSKIVVEGLRRIRVKQMLQRQPCLLAQVDGLVEEEVFGPVTEAMVQSVNALLKIALAYGRPLPGDVVKMIDQIGEAGRLADLVAVYLNLDLHKQQHLLEILDPMERLKDVYLLLAEEVQRLQIRGQVQSDVTKRLGKVQKEYLLREQMKEIQQELGDGDPRQAEIMELRKRIKERGLPDTVKKVAEKELGRLERINPASPEYTVARTYLDYLTNMPWSQGTPDELDLNLAEQILDEDHHDLKPAKERILEYLAVRSLKATVKGPILCFVGPPGVGKTSLGRSIARAMGRKFIRVSLGGMKDEAEIRGHRRTYIGALPGRIIQEICRCEANNPVFMLDEVDKIGQDFRGDPAAALLEVLDPEQNHSFNDHYLDVPFDLSRVMFIATANLLDPIPHALKDRMEVIQLSGYGDEDKVQIAFQYLIPKQQGENALDNYALQFEPAAVQQMIRGYTREAGVRGLERQIASICRKLARAIAQQRPYRLTITPQAVEELLGPRKFFTDVSAEEDRVGVVTGLAWTESGGDIIFVEAAAMPGNKDLILTGNLGSVMQESARAALSFVRGHAREFGISEKSLEGKDVHVHVPAGAIPKDGPSAGITLATALISLFSGRPARRDVAMTGELTLSGRILPIGGVKEKVLAARRAGVRTVLLPEHNRDHLQELEGPVLEDMTLILVEDMQQVVQYCLLPKDSAAASKPIEPPDASLLGAAT